MELLQPETSVCALLEWIGFEKGASDSDEATFTYTPKAGNGDSKTALLASVRDDETAFHGICQAVKYMEIMLHGHHDRASCGT